MNLAERAAATRPTPWRPQTLFLSLFLAMLLLPAIWYVNSPFAVTDDERTYAYFEKRGLTCSIGHDSIFGHPLRWVEVAASRSERLPIVLFTHGAPGAANNFFHFLEDPALLAHARLIAVDRLGYGPNDEGNAEVSIERQSEALVKVLSHYSYPFVIAVGHSYGGPITATLVIEHPERMKAAVLLAPALDPEQEQDFAIAKLTEWKATRWAVPAFFMVAAAEKKEHVKELNRLLPEWERLRVPVIHVHGTADRIVPYGNVAFAERVIPDTLLTVVPIEGGSHMIPWTERELIRDLIVRTLLQ